MKAKLIIYDQDDKECCASDISCSWDSKGEVLNIVCTRSEEDEDEPWLTIEDCPKLEEYKKHLVFPRVVLGMDEW